MPSAERVAAAAQRLLTSSETAAVPRRHRAAGRPVLGAARRSAAQDRRRRECRRSCGRGCPGRTPSPRPLEAKVDLLRRFRGHFDLGQDFVYGIFSADESAALGGTGLHTRAGDGAFEIGYWIRSDRTRSGPRDRRQAGALTRAAFEVSGVPRVIVRVDPDNAASLAVPRKLGFAEEGDPAAGPARGRRVARCSPRRDRVRAGAGRLLLVTRRGGRARGVRRACGTARPLISPAMAYEFKLPDLGEGLTEGEVARWLVSEGQEIAEDDPLVEIQTDKTTVEIPSPAAGKVARILVAEGEVVPVGTVLVVIGESPDEVRPSVTDDVVGARRQARSGEGARNPARAQDRTASLASISSPLPVPGRTARSPRTTFAGRAPRRPLRAGARSCAGFGG